MKSTTIRKIFHPFTRIPGVRTILGPMYKKLIYGPARQREIDMFQQNALSVLSEFNIVLEKAGVQYCLMWGSLIGAVRERGFIKHDFDIDVAVRIPEDNKDKVVAALLKAGFKHKHRFLVDGGINGMEDTVTKDGVDIDIFYIYKDRETGKEYCTSFNVIDNETSWEACIKKHGNLNCYRFFFPFPEHFVKTRFETIEMPIPDNYDEILKSYYGDGYMTPNPGWKSRDADYKWPERIVDYKTF